MIAEDHEKFRRDTASRFNGAREEGRKEGKREQAIEIARKLLKLNMPIDEIAKATDLTRKEIELFQSWIKMGKKMSEKAQSAYFAEKLAEAEHEAAKPNAVWLDENEFWNEDDWNTPSDVEMVTVTVWAVLRLQPSRLGSYPIANCSFLIAIFPTPPSLN